MAATLEQPKMVRVVCGQQENVEECYLTGEFNHWSLPGVAMRRGRRGEWMASIRLSNADIEKVRAVSYKDGRVVDVQQVDVGAIGGDVSKANSRSIGGHHGYMAGAL